MNMWIKLYQILASVSMFISFTQMLYLACYLTTKNISLKLAKNLSKVVNTVKRFRQIDDARTAIARAQQVSK